MSHSTVNSDSVRRPAHDLLRNTISQIPTHFGRLLYLSSLRNGPTGKYIHETLTNLLGVDDADRSLCHAHHKVFSEWLCFSLAEQKADLDEFVASAPGEISLQECRGLAPAGAREVERQLYITDLEMVLDLMRLAPNGASEAPDS